MCYLFWHKDIVRDVRGGVIHNYPLVKIGTQYWMRSNLETSLYVNDDALPKLNQVTANIAGYLQSTTEHYFYTANVALSGRISANSLEYTELGRLEYFKRLLEGGMGFKVNQWDCISFS